MYTNVFENVHVWDDIAIHTCTCTHEMVMYNHVHAPVHASAVLFDQE